MQWPWLPTAVRYSETKTTMRQDLCSLVSGDRTHSGSSRGPRRKMRAIATCSCVVRPSAANIGWTILFLGMGQTRRDLWLLTLWVSDCDCVTRIWQSALLLLQVFDLGFILRIVHFCHSLLSTQISDTSAPVSETSLMCRLLSSTYLLNPAPSFPLGILRIDLGSRCLHFCQKFLLHFQCLRLTHQTPMQPCHSSWPRTFGVSGRLGKTNDIIKHLSMTHLS
mmetsp:Transcript_6669/g.15215  ORF Transcript_6669/g.15215 Transcript_6669/m.15215 type:complete len:222 (+) Transcript_6669:113-778(+)